MAIVIGALRETAPGETRSALVPEVAKKFAALGATICAEHGFAESARIPDSRFEGVEFLGREEVVGRADVLLTVNPPPLETAAGLREGAVLVGLMQPHRSDELVGLLRDRKITSFAMELVPRISRAQSMDALSSQAAVAGYKAVLIAAMQLDKFLPMLTTAAGTIRPAKVLVIGAGVAGLQAIATARRLGAMVEGYDVRSATREQVQSLGAKFVDTGISAEGAGGYARELTAEEKAKQAGILADACRGRGRGHHHGGHPRAHRAAHHRRTDGRSHAAGLGDRRPRGGVGRQLRADTAGRSGRCRRRAGRRPGQPAGAVGRHASEMYARTCSISCSSPRHSARASSRSTGQTRCSRAACSRTTARSATRRPARRIEGASGGQG
jgi:H+-translocating NAD(P) transhydrogenase subunit alpha